jgi:hypothetical protein
MVGGLGLGIFFFGGVGLEGLRRGTFSRFFDFLSFLSFFELQLQVSAHQQPKNKGKLNGLPVWKHKGGSRGRSSSLRSGRV